MTEQNGVAHHIKDLDWQGEAALYSLTPPVLEADNAGVEHAYEHVIVHSVDGFYGPGTVIYPASSDGHVVAVMQLDGSYRGGLSHADALDLAGYELAND